VVTEKTSFLQPPFLPFCNPNMLSFAGNGIATQKKSGSALATGFRVGGGYFKTPQLQINKSTPYN
jgi:hypothetical protein